jgi:hypothetical protein
MAKSKELSAPLPQFVDKIKINGRMVPKPSMRNALIALDALDVACSYDTFADRRYVAGQLLGSQAGQITDDVCLLIRRVCRDRFAFDPGKDNLWDAVNLKCRLNSYHPILDYLERVELEGWDGTPRIDTWMIDYLGVADSKLVRAMSRLILIASVRRVRSPGCKWDYMPVLVGPENMAKSLSIATLYGPEYFSDQKIIGITDKELAEAVRGRWAIESAELAGLRKADIDHLKAQITRQTDRIRPAYGRAVVDVPRQGVLWGTTNDPIFLRSQHGNRRMVPLEPTKIDIAALKRDRDQIWAEASLAEREHGPSLALPADVWAEAKAKQEEHVESDPWADKLADFSTSAANWALSIRRINAKSWTMNGTSGEVEPIPYERREGDDFTPGSWSNEERVSSSWLLGTALKIPEERQTPAITHRLSTVMQQLGWSNPYLLKIGGTPQRGYKRKLR